MTSGGRSVLLASLKEPQRAAFSLLVEQFLKFEKFSPFVVALRRYLCTHTFSVRTRKIFPLMYVRQIKIIFARVCFSAFAFPPGVV
jgi:hypothetical protein